MVVDKDIKNKVSPDSLSIQTDRDTYTHTDRLCPIMAPHSKAHYFCQGPECAWFDFENDCCAVLAIGKILSSLEEWERDRA